jgi:hypothetical protein
MKPNPSRQALGALIVELTPNPALNRTGRYATSWSRAPARPIG